MVPTFPGATSRWQFWFFSPEASPTPWLEMEKYLGSAWAKHVGTGVSGGGESMWIPTKQEKQNIEQQQHDTKYEW